MKGVYVNDEQREKLYYYKDYITELAREILRKVGEMEREFYSLVGDSFGKLTVTKRRDQVSMSGGQTVVKPSWLCVCECGKEVVAETEHLTGGWITSCPDCSEEETEQITKEKISE